LVCQELPPIVAIDTFDSKIDTEIVGTAIDVKSELRSLEPIPGGRTPYDNYLWDFGDGHFSTQPEPTHQYAQPGSYEVTLYAINNYDFGPKPKRPKKKVEVSSALAAIGEANPFEQNFFTSNGTFQIFKLSDAKTGEDISFVVG